MTSMFSNRAVLVLGLCILTVVGCTGKGPLTPEGGGQHALDGATPLDLGMFAAGDVIEAPIARYHFEASETGVQLTPTRLAQAPVGQLFNVDITDALTQSFCHDCLEVLSFTKVAEGLNVALRVRHPFALADDAGQPTAGNRRDLWISNVKGILLIDGTDSFFGNQVQLRQDLVVNADGYTGIFDKPTGLNATVFPYKVFGANGANRTTGNFDGTFGWTQNYNDPSGYNVLANAQTGSANYILRLSPGETIDADFVLTASFASSASKKEDRLIPAHFMPAGAAPEPWKVLVNVAGNLAPNDTSSTTTLTFQALDWQQDPALSVDPAFPDLANRHGLATASRIAAVTYSLPDITGEPITLVDLTGAAGSGVFPDVWGIDAPLQNATAVGEGTYWGLAKFLDERDPQSTAGPFGTTTFVKSDLVTPYTTVTEFATYSVFSVTVGSGGGCLDFNQFHSADSPIYMNPEPLYAAAGSMVALQALLRQLDDKPIPLPPIDFTTQKVIVACAGFFDGGLGLHTIDINSVCPNAGLGWTVTLGRGEPLGNCPQLPISTAPYVLALVDTTSPEFAFAEEFFDTCGPSLCIPQMWDEVEAGDAAPNGFVDTKPLTGIATTQGEFDTLAQPLFGGNPLPPIDFSENDAVVICSGYFHSDLGDRYLSILDICREALTGTVMVTWDHGEYVNCGVADGTETAPYIIATIPKTTLSSQFNENITDVCLPPEPCDNDIGFSVVAQADIRDAVTQPATAQRFTALGVFALEWIKYFPEMTAPVIDFGANDAYLIVLEKTGNSGASRISIDQVCYDPGGNLITVQWTNWKPLFPSCPAFNIAPSQQVILFTAPRVAPTGNPTVVFEENLEDFCSLPSCAGPVAKPFADGNGADAWKLPHGTDMVINTQEALKAAWNGVHNDGSNPPNVDFDAVSVVFTTSGYYDDGVEQRDIELTSACDGGLSSTIFVTDYVPQTCPPPLPVPTAPYQFVMIDKPFGGDPGFFAFSRVEQDTCSTEPQCIPEPAQEVGSGDYPDNPSMTHFEGYASDTNGFRSIWNSFFTDVATRPPLPMVDFVNQDVGLFSSGFTLDGSGQRTLNTFALCVDAAAEYVEIDLSVGEPQTCVANIGTAHPWSCVLLPKGAAVWTHDVFELTVDTCGMGFCFDFEEIAASFTSLYRNAEPLYFYIGDPDFDVRIEDYRAVWALVGTGDPPGLAGIGPEDAIIVVLHGQSNSGLGQHDVTLESFCADINGRWLASVARHDPISGCPVNQTVNSAYRIYKLPLVGLDSIVFDDSLQIDTCAP